MITDEKVKQLLEQITALENRVEEPEQATEEFKQENQQLRQENKRFRAKVRWNEEPHTPPSKDQSEQEESSSSDEDDEQPCTDGGTSGRKSGHDPEWRDVPDPDREIEATCDCCPECGEAFDESAGVSPRLVEELPDPQPLEVPQYNWNHYECHSCGTETVASHPDCPNKGQFGVNVIAQAALSRYDHRLPYRKIGDRFEQLYGLELSGAAAWHATERAARVGRCEYEQIRHQIQQADVVHVDETGIKRDGEQAWIWTFTTENHTLHAVRESRGSDVPAEIRGEDFAGTVVCDGWTAYPAFSSNLQRCWAHIFREAEDAAEKQAEGEPIYRTLKQLYVAFQTRMESDLTVRERVELLRVARRQLESLIKRSVPDGPVATLLGKIEGGLDHWLTFHPEEEVNT
ncbi:Transposase [Halorientalis persicus]|uniref:Transposase n=1 Tax=Halorientalis persicus TaxID=1367881 RepID=A0A1H8X2B5_9EURY|nr:IS66 family transposase [Halorientalis persicus]SEP34016.1 Transposase [Halorientalis persicus]